MECGSADGLNDALNVDFVRRDTVPLRAMMMAYLKVLGRRWSVVEVRAEAVDVGLKCEEWVVGLGSLWLGK